MSRPSMSPHLNDLTGCAPGKMMAVRCENVVPEFFKSFSREFIC